MSAKGRSLRAVILQHEDPTPPGHVTQWLDQHGAEQEVFRIDLEDRDLDPTEYDLVVSLGSEFAAFDESHAFVPREYRLMSRAVVAGRSLGLQFHPEVTPEIMGDWVRTYRHELDAEGVGPDALLEETNRRAAESKGTSWRLLERFLDRVARLTSRVAT